jgi:hypothetical protein
VADQFMFASRAISFSDGMIDLKMGCISPELYTVK